MATEGAPKTKEPEYAPEELELADRTAKEKETPPEEDVSEEELNSVQPGKASPFDIDFILILFFALVCDLAIDPLIETIGLPTLILPILNRGLDILTVFIIGGWIYWKSSQFVLPEKLGQKLKGMESKVMAKIQAQISKKVGSKVMKKVLIRAVPALVAEMIPGVAIFTSWVAAVVSMLF